MIKSPGVRFAGRQPLSFPGVQLHSNSGSCLGVAVVFSFTDNTTAGKSYARLMCLRNFLAGFAEQVFFTNGSFVKQWMHRQQPFSCSLWLINNTKDFETNIRIVLFHHVRI